MKKILLGGFMAALLTFSIAPQAKADSFSISYSSGGHHYYSGGHAKYKSYKHKHRYKNYYRHKARGHAHGWGHRFHKKGYRHIYHGVVWPRAAVHTPTIIYQNVSVEPAPTSIYTPPTALLANQSSPTYSIGGQTCREYQAQVNIGGRIQDTYGTACLQPDGAWRITD